MCGLQTFDVNRKPVEIFVVLDRSASMEDGLDDSTSVSATNPSKWSQLIPALATSIQARPIRRSRPGNEGVSRRRQ